ncbi:PadR family transcriptional regulator [Rugosimonospora acidiphila]|uniref:PadR family transcriptional regulator n=1 Tax=Rugosimonospora acidiphila TaxID=556531 RepID=UPI0031F1AA71
MTSNRPASPRDGQPESQSSDLSPTAWAVLGAIAEGPTHGFAVAQLLAVDGPLGRIWTVPRPLVYRELGKLIERGLVDQRATERGGRGPARTIVEASAAGRRAVARWLAEPVEHVRDVRSLFMLKLALHARAGTDARELLLAQRRRLEPQLVWLDGQRERSEGFDRTLAMWRAASCRAALEFVYTLLAEIGSTI